MPPNQQIAGVIPAVLLPRDHDRVAWDQFDRLLEFLLGFDIAGVCVNGATGEYVMATPAERREAVRRARQFAASGQLVVSGVGGANLHEVQEHAAASTGEGADALLVPAPHFFRYEQQDLAEFFTAFADESQLPVLLYNLAAFTGALQADTVLRLVSGSERIAGIKDSSGSLDNLEALKTSGPSRAVRLVGHDGVLAEAIRRSLCHGVISGIAGVLPELTLALWNASAAFEPLAARQQLLIEQFDHWPTPWALKIIAERRGFAPASFPVPLSPARARRRTEFEHWFDGWWEHTVDLLPQRPRVRMQEMNHGSIF